ncbi:MAG: hypothetical protein QM734_07605 [Cyclobacteriaceae bacterium]
MYVVIAELTSSIGIAKYWKNGNIINLSDGSSYSQATSILLSGSDVYIGGTTDGIVGGGMGVPVYWKNGQLNYFDSIDSSKNA